MASNVSTDRGARFFTAVFVVCFAILGFALYLQHVKNLDPCPWCVAQRIGFLTIGLVALVAALWRPRVGGIAVFGGLMAFVAIAGAAAASYHLYLQADPARAQACLGSLVEKVIDWSHLGRWVPPVFMYDGPCTLKPWSLLGLSIPAWSLVCFVLLGIAAIAAPFWARRR